MVTLSTIGTAVGIGSKVLGAFSKKGGQPGGSRHSKKNKEYERDRLKLVRTAADRAGFNPLTALMSGQPIGQTGIGAQSAPLASHQLLASAAADFANLFDTEADQREATENRLRDAQADLAELEVERIKAGDAGVIAARAGALGTRPAQAMTGADVFRSSAPFLNEFHKNATGIGDEATRYVEKEEGAKLANTRQGYTPNPMPTGETFETLYGDTPLSWAYGAGRLGFGGLWLGGQFVNKHVNPSNWTAPPSVKYPRLSAEPFHQNTRDRAAILQNRIGE